MAEIEPRTFTLKTGERCLVRSARETDARVLLDNAREMMTHPWNVTQPDELTLTEDQERAWIKEHREKPGWLALVPEVEGRVVGIINFENGKVRRLAHRGTLGMTLLAEWHGRGIGDALLTALVDWARANPLIEKVCLAVIVGNEPAIGLYRKHGFVEEGRRNREVQLRPGEFVDDFLMFKLVK